MIKILILCKKSETAKALINYVVSEVDILRVVGIANNNTEALNLLEQTKPNLIISSNKSIILLIKKHFKHYTPAVILLSKNTEELPYFYKPLLMLPYNLSFELMTEKIRIFLANHLSVSKKEQLLKILTEIGFNLKLSGTMYLIDSILYKNTFKGGSSFEKLEKDIYSYVAQKNNTTVKIVKWSIERSILYLHESLTKEKYFYVEKYLAVEYPKKPTPKLVINTLSSLISL